MARPKLTRPTDGELEILTIMWARGDATVRDVFDDMSAARPIAQTTVGKRMQTMHERGLLIIVDERRPATFRPAFDRTKTYSSVLSDVVKRVFHGSPSQAIMHLLRVNKISPAERAAVQEQLDKME